MKSKGYKDNYFVSSNHYNNVKHIYSGRMVKSDANNKVEYKPVNKAFFGKN